MHIRLVITALMICLSLAPVTTNAAEAGLRLAASNGLSLDAAVQQVREQTGGRILSAETVTRDGEKYHRIKVLLPDGTVRIVILNAG